MRKFLFPVVLVTSLSVGAGGFAAGGTVTTGVVKSVDAKTMMVTLQDGTAYKLPAKFKANTLKSGEKVEITWATIKNVKDAEKVTVVK